MDKGHSVVDVAKRLSIAEGLIYTWVRKSAQSEQPLAGDLQVLQDEVLKLKAELRRSTEERDILKKAAVSSIDQCNTIYLNRQEVLYGKDGATWAVRP